MNSEFERQEDGTRIEFSEIRLNIYREVIYLWNRDSESLARLSRIMDVFYSNRGRLIDSDYEILSRLSKVGLLNTKEMYVQDISFFKQRTIYNCTLLDKDFFKFIFYKKENSSVLHLANVYIIEKRRLNVRALELSTDLTYKNKCLIL